MAEMEEKLGAMLGNPDFMQKVMAMAQSLGQSAETAPEKPGVPPPSDAPQLDPAMLQKLLTLGAQTGIDRNGQALLKALSPYLSRQRIGKLERAMRAARLAKAAANSGALSFLTGR